MGKNQTIENEETLNLLIKNLNYGLMNLRNQIHQLENIPSKSINDYCTETKICLSVTIQD